MAICDARNMFMVVDIDIYGFNNDSRGFRYSLKRQSFFENKTNKKKVSYFLVEDKSFPLEPWLMWL